MKFDKIIGTGGIGIGMLFQSDQLETLGRSESRAVTLSPAKDYCKQQIVLYYAVTLLKEMASVYPIGFIGNDSNGSSIIAEMRRQGLNVDYIAHSREYPTTISICLQYPDKETCNFTAINSASELVTPEYVLGAMKEIGVDEKTIVCAIPEVPIDTRVEMMKFAKLKGALTVLSVPVSEAEDFARRSVYGYVDILAVNMEEAQAIANSKDVNRNLIIKLAEVLGEFNPSLTILMTCGKEGAYTFAEQMIEKIPPLLGNALNTTGAGDAFLGGTLAGIAGGMKLQKGNDDSVFGETTLESAPELGTICAGMAVEYEDSIVFNVNPDTIRDMIEKRGWKIGYRCQAINGMV